MGRHSLAPLPPTAAAMGWLRVQIKGGPRTTCMRVGGLMFEGLCRGRGWAAGLLLMWAGVS